jgi:hypothetical protein
MGEEIVSDDGPLPLSVDLITTGGCPPNLETPEGITFLKPTERVCVFHERPPYLRRNASSCCRILGSCCGCPASHC